MAVIIMPSQKIMLAPPQDTPMEHAVANFFYLHLNQGQSLPLRMRCSTN